MSTLSAPSRAPEGRSPDTMATPSDRRRHTRRPWGLIVAAWVVGLGALAPLAFLLLETRQSGWGAISHVLFRRLTGSLLFNTLAMAGCTTLVACVLGVGAAWVLERTDVPMRRAFFVLLVIPAAIPDFIETFGWIGLWPSLHGLWGAVFVLSLAVYPFVMLPVIAVLRRIDQGREEVARSLGVSGWGTFVRVTLPELRVPIAGGALVVVLQLLAEYGSFQMLGFRTFTTQIFAAFKVGFDLATASALSLVLVVISAILVRIESQVGRSGRTLMTSTGGAPKRHALGPSTPFVVVGLLGLVVLALVVPVGEVVRLLANPGRSLLPTAPIWGPLGQTVAYAAAAGVLAVIGATIVAMCSHRARGWLRTMPSAASLVPLAVPGVVVALAFTYMAENYLQGRMYQTSALLVLAYAVMFLPLAFVGIRASLLQVPASLGEVAASLGAKPWRQFVRITLPLIAPGLAVGFALVFLTTLTELTATLVLIPTGVQTLATEFWVYQSNLAYGQAAPYAAAMIVVASLPLALVSGLDVWRAKRS